MSASASDVSSATPTVTASARKNVPVTPVIEISGRKTTIGVMVEPISGTRISAIALRMASRAVLAGVAVHHDVLDDDDGVVDHQADGGGQAAERHQVEALAQHAQRDEGDRDRGRNHQPGDERRAPVAQEQHHDERRQNQADQDRVAHALDGVVDDVRLIVERLQLDARRQLAADAARSPRAPRRPPSTVLLSGCRKMFSSTAGLPLAVTTV